MPFADVGRQEFTAALQHDRAKHGALRQREPLPERFEDRLLLGEQAQQRLMQVVERRAAAARGAHIVPGLVSEPLHVVGKVARQLHDRDAQSGLGADARLVEARLDEHGELVRGDLVEAHHRTGLVERTPRSDHALHQAWLRAGKYVAHLALVLDGRAHRVLHGPTVESGDRLELVEGDDELAAARLGETGGQSEHLLGQPGDVAFGLHAWKRDGEAAEGIGLGGHPDLGARRADDLEQPGAGPVPAALGGNQGARVSLEERDIGAEAADRDLDGERAAPRHRRERVPDERRLAVAPRRDEEHLLRRREVADQPLQLDGAVDERRGRHHFAVDERVVHYVNSRSRYAD